MIILEFIIFVVSSGLFCSEKFRHHIWAVIVAGAIATGSSLLFAYDLGHRMISQGKEPSVITKIVKQTIEKPGRSERPKTIGKPHSCVDQYPMEARKAGEQGATFLAFKILADGTVDNVTVTASSGSPALDEAAVKCVANWHYRPALKDGQIVDADWNTKVTWKLDEAEKAAEAQAKAQEPEKTANTDAAKAPKTDEHVQVSEQPVKSHHWYDIGSWFSSDSDPKPPQQQQAN